MEGSVIDVIDKMKENWFILMMICIIMFPYSDFLISVFSTTLTVLHVQCFTNMYAKLTNKYMYILSQAYKKEQQNTNTLTYTMKQIETTNTL